MSRLRRALGTIVHKYQFNIGDYYKKAGRLSMLEHGAYRLLMDAIYDREVWPTREEAIEWTWAATPEQVQAVDFVLSRFFQKVGERYQQTRILEELTEYHSFVERQSANGKKGGRKGSIHKQTKNPLPDDALPNEMPSLFPENPPLCDGGDSESLTNNQQPATINQPDTPELGSSAGAPRMERCPVEQIIELYRLHAPSLVQPRLVPDAVKAAISARWRQSPKHRSLEFWERFFKRCEQSDFLAGRVAPSFGRRQFRAGLEWVVGATNFAKIINGNYTNQE